MVNILVLDADSDSDSSCCEKDEWGVMMPPKKKEGYLDEMASPVFRYCNGSITTLPAQQGHMWYRSGWHADGGIISHYSQIGNTDRFRPEYFTPYETFTVFRGWKFRPVVFMPRDATVYDVDRKDVETCELVVSIDNKTGSGTEGYSGNISTNKKRIIIAFNVLGFGRRTDGPGHPNTSMAVLRCNPYAAGRDASWVGKLVPESYTNPIPQTARSDGLAGSLPLILGLMYVFPRLTIYQSRQRIHSAQGCLPTYTSPPLVRISYV